jgi:N-acetylneuraminic acid mutarotase
MPTPRDHLAVSVVEGKVYVTGGRLGTFARNLAANEKYDLGTDSWSKVAPLPTPRSGIASAVVDGRIYVFGGEAVEGTFEANERYDPGTDTWKGAPPLPTARHGLSAVALDNRIYVLAGGPTPGGSQSALNEVFIVLGK